MKDKMVEIFSSIDKDGRRIIRIIDVLSEDVVRTYYCPRDVYYENERRLHIDAMDSTNLENSIKKDN